VSRSHAWLVAPIVALLAAPVVASCGGGGGRRDTGTGGAPQDGSSGSGGTGGGGEGGAGGAPIVGCADAPAFTTGTWQLYDAVDDAGRDWSGSALVFVSALLGADGCLVDGYFDWMSNDRRTGRDLVRGTYQAPTRALQMETYSLENPQGIVPSQYDAAYDPATDELVGGTWTCNCAAGVWTARHLSAAPGGQAP
jgi:hypothetical protein